MSKQAISLTLDPANLLWLRARTRALGARSVSETVDWVIRDARLGPRAAGLGARSVVGTVRIGAGDPGLLRADAAVRALVERRRAGRSRSRHDPAAEGGVPPRRPGA